MKCQTLQKRLIKRTEQVVEKDLHLQEKEKLYMELKLILSRQPGPELALQLSTYQVLAPFLLLLLCLLGNTAPLRNTAPPPPLYTREYSPFSGVLKYVRATGLCDRVYALKAKVKHQNDIAMFYCREASRSSVCSFLVACVKGWGELLNV